MRRLLLGLLLVPPGCARPAPARPASLLLVTIDTLRADRVGAYGDARGDDIPATAETENSARGSDFSQLDLRVAKRFTFGASRACMELIAEMFNVFNDTNPGGYVGNMRSATFGQPTTFSGDFRRGEQRIAQLGLRLEL